MYRSTLANLFVNLFQAFEFSLVFFIVSYEDFFLLLCIYLHHCRCTRLLPFRYHIIFVSDRTHKPIPLAFRSRKTFCP